MASTKKTTATQPATTPVVKPVLRFNNAPHALETALKAKEAPEIKSVGLVKLDTGWVACMLVTKGDKVLEIIPGEPNMKKIAIDEAKVNFVEQFMGDF